MKSHMQLALFDWVGQHRADHFFSKDKAIILLAFKVNLNKDIKEGELEKHHAELIHIH